MIDPQSHAQLRKEVEERMSDDRQILDTLRAEIRPLRTQVRRIQPRTTTSISLVGTDGGNNRLQFDPFLFKVLSRYRLAMSPGKHLDDRLSRVRRNPREIEEKAYVWSEYARGDDREMNDNKFVAGKMFFAKFGRGKRDPIWPVDIYLPQVSDAQMILGYLFS